MELDDWNCCGSTPYGPISDLEALAVAARDLALAEKTGLDLVTPCPSCYITLTTANSRLKDSPQLKSKVDEALAAGGLQYNGTVKVRHLLEVLVNDIGYEKIQSKVRKKLTGLKVAPYYGCQLTRPELGFDDPEFPTSLDQLMEALGAEATPFPLKARCCGSSLVTSEEDTVLDLVHKLLESAQQGGAECLVTACPLCHLNLDAYQSKVNSKFHTKYKLPIFFFTQLMGLAFELRAKDLGLNTNIVSPSAIVKKYL
jgi:heterodisulfide reductase subunit B